MSLPFSVPGRIVPPTSIRRTEFFLPCPGDTGLENINENHAYRLVTGGGSYFVKVNLADALPQMSDDEVRGLQLLADTHNPSLPGMGSSQPAPSIQ